MSSIHGSHGLYIAMVIFAPANFKWFIEQERLPDTEWFSFGNFTKNILRNFIMVIGLRYEEVGLVRSCYAGIGSFDVCAAFLFNKFGSGQKVTVQYDE